MISKDCLACLRSSTSKHLLYFCLLLLVLTSASANIVSIPLKAIPPREQKYPKSPKGMPYRLRLIDTTTSHRSSFIRRLLGLHSVYEVELLGGIIGVGEYYTEIWLGDYQLRVQVDTGSSTLAVPITGCKSCHKHGRYYKLDPQKNKEDVVDVLGKGQAIKCLDRRCKVDTCGYGCNVCSVEGACCSKIHPFECGFSLRYADKSSASGSLITDEVEIGGLKSNVTFGGILENSKSFERKQVDGIMGMAFESLACNPTCIEPVFDSVVKRNGIRNVFSICMNREGGVLHLGGIENSTIREGEQLDYAPLLRSLPMKYYRLRLNGHVYLQDKNGEKEKVDERKVKFKRRVKLPNFKRAIVDTGATLIVVSTLAFNTLKQDFQSHYCHIPELCGSISWFQNGMCVSLSSEDLKKLPTISFAVGDEREKDRHVMLEFEPEEYMIEYYRGGKNYRCIGIMGLDGIGGLVILGNTVMQKYITVYDRENYQIGFAKAARNCGRDGRERNNTGASKVAKPSSEAGHDEQHGWVEAESANIGEIV